MPDIWCSFNAFVDYDVYFDETIGDKQTGDQTFWENQCVYNDYANMYIMFPTKRSFRQMQIERERDRQTDR